MEEEGGAVSESKTRNRLALESAQNMAYIRTNSSDVLKGADKEILLSVLNVLDHDEEGV